MVSSLRKRILWALLAAAAVLLGLAGLFLPPKDWIEGRIKSALEAQGFSKAELELSHVGLRSSTIRGIKFGEPPFILNNITLHYSPMDLLSGKLQGMEAEGLALDVRKTGEAWKIAGFSRAEERGQQASPFVFLATKDALDFLPFDEADLKNSTAHIATDNWQLDLPLDLSFQKQPKPHLSYAASGLTLKSAKLGAATGKATFDVSLNENDRWEGTWAIDDIAVTGVAEAMPALNAKGTLTLQTDRMRIEGRAQDDANAYKAVFEIIYSFSSPDQSLLVVKDAVMPWHGGRVSTQNAKIPFKGNMPLAFDLKIDGVSADALMQQVTGKRASASGTISGTLPVSLAADGTIAFHGGKLYAEGPGHIAVSPDVISGTNERLVLVRDVLKDFRYTSLSIDIESSRERGVELLMRLEGSNPEVQQGRPVKLNVNLKGDVLGFIQQNLLWLTDPRKLMERGINANP